jgi:hypothetical protein
MEDRMQQKVKPTSRYPDGNPKTAFGMKKPPLWYVPFTALYKTALAHLHGALKYGHFNWREDPVSASVYINAALRHIADWKEGAEIASDSRVHHLAHACACLNIIMDAQQYGTLIDDRHPTDTDFDQLFEELRPTIDYLYDTWGPKSKPHLSSMGEERERKQNEER